MSLTIDEIVKVTDSIEPSGVLLRNFGIGLFLTTDTQLGTGSNRIAVLASFQDAEDQFTVNSSPYNAANIWFQQSPQPQNLIVGRWINAATSAALIGSKLTNTLAQFQAITAGSFTMSIDGTLRNITGLNFSEAMSFTAIATIIQGAITTAGSAVAVVFDSVRNAFVITNNATGSSSLLTYAGTAGSGTDISAMLKWTSATGAQLSQGANVETVQDALNAIFNLNNSFYWIQLDDSLDDTQTVLDISAWVAAQRFMYSAGSSDPQVLVTGDSASIAAQLFALKPVRTFMTWSATSDLKSTSISARFSSVNFSAANSVITAKFKTLPGTLADDLTVTEQTELDRKRVNYYAPFSGDDIYAEGTTFDPSAFIDVRYCLDWFVNAVQVAVYDLLKGSGRLPQDDDGEASIVAAITGVCDQAITNGMIAPGQVSQVLINDIVSVTGNTSFDGFLSKGYLIYSQPSAQQSQADRVARKATAKNVWLKASGAIHSVDISVVLEN